MCGDSGATSNVMRTVKQCHDDHTQQLQHNTHRFFHHELSRPRLQHLPHCNHVHTANLSVQFVTSVQRHRDLHTQPSAWVISQFNKENTHAARTESVSSSGLAPLPVAALDRTRNSGSSLPSIALGITVVAAFPTHHQHKQHKNITTTVCT